MTNSILHEVESLKQRFETTDPYVIIEGLGINLLIRSLGSLKGFYCMELQQRYIVINGNLEEREQLMVAAHELGHDRLHQHLAKISPLKDFLLYDMTSKAESQANVFASELLIDDSVVEQCVSEGLDYFGLCSSVGFNPQFVTFKLYGMVQRGYKLNLPESPNSAFLQNKGGIQ